MKRPLVHGALGTVVAASLCLFLSSEHRVVLIVGVALSLILLAWIACHGWEGPLAAVVVAIAFTPEVVVASLPLRAEDFIVPCWLVVAWRQGRWRGLWGRALTGIIMAWMTIVGIATMRGMAQGWIQPGVALCHGGKTLEYLLLSLLVCRCLTTVQDVRWAVWCSVAAAVASALLFGVMTDLVVPDTELRHIIEEYFPGEGSNILGGYFMYQSLIGISICLAQPAQRRMVLLAGALFLPLASALFSTASRSSLVGSLVGFTALGAWVNRWLWLVVILLVLLAPWYLPPGTWYFVRLAAMELTGQVRWNWATRLEEWRVDWDYIRQRPLLGYGLSIRPPSPMTGQAGPVDNEYLKVWLETGLFGLVVFAWFLVRAGRVARRVYQTSADPWCKALAAGYGAGLIALLIHGLLATSFTAVRTAEAFWFMTGILIVADRLVSPTP